MSQLIFNLLGLGGTGIVLGTIVVSVILYRGKQGERYSLFNRFISELGDVGVSRGAWIFNLGLILGGMCLLPCVVWLGIFLNSLTGWLGMAAGIIAALGVTAVGFFPMNNLESHTKAAMTFFRGGLVMIFFFGLALLLQPSGEAGFPKWINWLSLVAVFFYTWFLIQLTLRVRKKQAAGGLEAEEQSDHARFRLLPTLEWGVFLSTIAWLCAVSLSI